MQEIKKGNFVMLRSGDEIKCHQHGKDDGKLVLVDEAPPMPQKDTDPFEGRAIEDGGRYVKWDKVEFCMRCIYGIMPSV